MDTLVYIPKSKENKLVYEQIIARIHRILKDHPQDVLKSYTDEIIAVLKAEDKKDDVKKLELETFLGPLSQEEFEKFL